MVPTLTRNQPVTWGWLWSQHNEHRVPLPRLIFLGLNWLTVIDMRVTMCFDVLVMAALAAAMILVADPPPGPSQPGGRVLPAGAAPHRAGRKPAVGMAAPVLRVGGPGMRRAARDRAGWRDDSRSGARRSRSGVCALLLPLCGANGLGMVPALAAWPLALALLPERWTGTGEHPAAPAAPGARRRRARAHRHSTSSAGNECRIIPRARACTTASRPRRSSSPSAWARRIASLAAVGTGDAGGVRCHVAAL